MGGAFYLAQSDAASAACVPTFQRLNLVLLIQAQHSSVLPGETRYNATISRFSTTNGFGNKPELSSPALKN